MSVIIDNLETTLRQTILTGIDLLPQLIGAAIVLGVVAYVAPKLAEKATDAIARLGVFGRLETTPLGATGADGTGDLRDGTETVLELYGYVVGGTIALTILRIGLISQLASDLLFYATFVVVGLGLLALASIVATAAGNRAARWEPVQGTAVEPAVGGIVQAALYLVAGVIVLDLLGLHTGIILVVVRAATLGIALAFALAIGISLGLASKDHVAEYVDGILGEGDRATAATSDDD